MRNLSSHKRSEVKIANGAGAFAAKLRRAGLLVALSLGLGWGLGGATGCSADPSSLGAADEPPLGLLRQGLCSPGDTGGDFGCGCTLNSQCNGFDDDARLIVCDVPAGGSVGKCLDCTATAARPIGCACIADSDCATGSKCNGRTCQKLRDRGEFCVRDSDCGGDLAGPMNCLPTKSWCGPLPDGYYCDFQTDCLSGTCRAGSCTSGAAGSPCSLDTDCKGGLVCLTLPGLCGDKQADGLACKRNAECQNQCNSFSGLCTLGKAGTLCTLANPDGDCATGLSCVDCAGSFTCRPTGTPCM